MASSRALLLLATLVVPTLGATYNLVDTYQGAGFLSGFTHQAIADPTHGRVNYLDLDASMAANLTYGAFLLSRPVIPRLADNVNSEREQICDARGCDAHCG